MNKVKPIFVLLAAILASSYGEARKLPVGAYIKTAKIEILSGEPERYEYAMVMLDSLFLNYGHHAEALSWMEKIMDDMIDKAATFEEKRKWVDKLVAYADTLEMTCENKDIKKKYRKNCKKFIEESKTGIKKYWREFYNAGIEQKNEITRIAEDIAAGVDDDTKEFYDKQLAALTDSSRENLTLAISLNPSDGRPYIAFGSIYQDQHNLEESIKWLKLGLDRTTDRKPLLTTIAYNYVEMDDYCSAVPFFREYIDLEPGDLVTINNLSISYNNCGMYDSAVAMYNRILEADPENASALRGLANYHFQKGRDSRDSARHYTEADDETAVKVWREKEKTAFDSARALQKRVFELTPDVLEAAERYGMMSYLVADYEGAAVAYARATEIDPSIAENWSILGDCYVTIKKFHEAADAYEHVVEIEPDKLDIWERLSELYVMTNQPKKKAAADKKVAELK